MQELKYLYLSIKERISQYKNRGYSDKEIEIELRLDLENCIDLLASELNIVLEKNETS